MRKAGLVIAIATAAFFLLSGVALANFGAHGGYTTDTDACAGCHRAHTAVSSITWTDTEGGVKNALLIGGTTLSTLEEFCYTCHGDLGAGAATNVQAGVYDNSAARVGPDYISIPGYGTPNSIYGAVLNGGGFDDIGGAGATMTSWHEVSSASGVAWGGIGTDNPDGSSPSGGTSIVMDCASCHDPHGSSNYRILKDTVNGVAVGGYLGGIDSGPDPDPTPFVVSNEEGYPAGAPGEDLGFRLHKQYPTYYPDYTTARYARSPGSDVTKGMSGWCAACHTQYNTISSSGQGAYNAADGYGYVTRHRHPVNQPLSTFKGDRSLILGTTDTNTPWGDTVDIPLEHDPLAGGVPDGRGNLQRQGLDDWLGCLTCHRAHGTNATMDGYANSASAVFPQPNSGGTTPTSKGVPPAGTSVLLRANNRGVCERCHNK